MKKIFSILVLLFTKCTPGPCQVDPLEFPPGHPNVSNMPTFIEQLNQSPFPRYKAGHTLLPNYNVVDQIYAGDYKQPGVSDNTAVDRSVAIQLKLAQKYNYMINLGWFGGYYNDETIKLANQNPQFKRAIMTLRAQVTGGTKMWKQDFPNSNYLQNAQGQFLDWGGGITQAPYKTWSPRSNPNDYSSDGDGIRIPYQTSLQNLVGNVDMVNEDGEVTPIIEQGGIMNDPNCVSEMNSSGLFMKQFPFIKWFAYLGKKVAENDLAYSAKFRSLPKLQNAIYTEYRLTGQVSYEVGAWEFTRMMQDKINNQYYSTGDFYVRWADNWKDWRSAWHGLKWFSQSRYCELFLGDKLFSPFIGAGWDCNAEANVLSAQWLGLLKILGIWGTEFYYVGYFNEYTTVPCNPKTYAYQNIIPAYAQETTSRYEDILRNGNVMDGDLVDNTYPLGVIPKYQFNTGVENKLVFGRKYGNEYVILGIIENYSNIINSTPLTGTATFNMDGESITLPLSRCGKTFHYNKTNKTLMLLDGHHENKHPINYSKDWNEQFYNADTTNGTLKTNFYIASNNWTSFKSTISLTQNQFANFHMTPTIGETKYLFVKGSGSGNLEVKVDQSVSNINITQDGWYKLSIGNLSETNHAVVLKSLATHEIDSICITGNPNKYPVSVCTPPSAVISASNPDPCNGDTVLLSASTGASYQWSDGRTSQTITVFNNATYTVTVSNGQCSSASAPYAVSFKICSTCQAPGGLYNTPAERRYVYIYWNRVATADSGYTIYIRDITKVPFIDLPALKKRQLKKSLIQIKATGLLPNHKYEYYMVANCSVQMDSKKSITIPFTTKGNTVAKLSQR